MRILRLDVQGSRFEFHPYVSVLRSLSADHKALLLDVFRGLPTGSVPSASGLIEAYEVVLDLDTANLALLDLVPTVDGDARTIDVVVRADHVPGADVSLAAREHANLTSRRDGLLDEMRNAETAAEGAELESRRDERQRAETSLAEARVELISAQTAHTEVAAAFDEAQHRREAFARTVSECTDAIESARSTRDPFAAAALEAAQQRVNELEEAHDDTADDANHETTADEVSGRIVALETARQSLEGSLLSLDAIDPGPVEVALAQVENEGHVSELMPSDEAQSIADQWVRVTARLSDSQPMEGVDPAALRAARKRLKDARAAVFEAERAIRLRDIPQEDAAALERAHEDVVARQYRLTKRLSGGKALQRRDAAREREQEILDRVGFRTYTDYVLGTSTLDDDPAKQRAIDVARTELSAAEDDLTALEALIDAELARAELRNQQKVLRIRTIELLGEDPGEDIEWALRQLRVPPRAGDGRVGRLRHALEAAGVALAGDDMPAAMLVDAANVWLDEQRDAAAQRAQVEADLAVNDGELAAAQMSATELAGVMADTSERRRRQQMRLADAQSALVEAQRRVEHHAAAEREAAIARVDLEQASADEEEAAADVARLEQALVMAADDVQAKEAVVAAAEEALVVATSAEHEAVDVERVRNELAAVEAQLAGLPATEEADAQEATAEELEWYILSRLAAQRSVSFAGSVPIVLDDALAGQSREALEHVLESLERMAVAVQIIVLTDDPHVALWADHVGADRAAIVEAALIG